jgi:hypothetical protein
LLIQLVAVFIRFFKSSFFVQFLVIGLTGLLLWANAMADPPGMPAPQGPVPLYHAIFSLLKDQPFLSSLAGFLVILAQTYFLTLIFNQHQLILKNSSLSALLFVVLMSFLPGQLTLNPVNLSISFLLVVIYQLLISYNKQEHFDRFFAAGFFLAIAAMIYLPIILWFIFVIISLVLSRNGNWRAWLAATIGLLTPFIYLASWYFIEDSLLEHALEYPRFFFGIMEFPNPFHTDFYILSGMTLFIASWGLFAFSSRARERTVEIRAKTSTILWTLVFTLLTFPLSGTQAIYHPSLAMPALSMVITGTLLGLKKHRMAEVILLLYFLAILLNNLLIHKFIYR